MVERAGKGTKLSSKARVHMIADKDFMFRWKTEHHLIHVAGLNTHKVVDYRATSSVQGIYRLKLARMESSGRPEKT